MNRKFICIICPNSCQLKVEYEGKRIIDIQGALCSKGKDFVKNEITNPLRVFVGSIKVSHGNFKLLSVKSTEPIPKKYLLEIGKITHALEVRAPIKIGQVIARNLLNKHIDLVATRKVQTKNLSFKK